MKGTLKNFLRGGEPNFIPPPLVLGRLTALTGLLIVSMHRDIDEFAILAFT